MGINWNGAYTVVERDGISTPCGLQAGPPDYITDQVTHTGSPGVHGFM